MCRDYYHPLQNKIYRIPISDENIEKSKKGKFNYEDPKIEKDTGARFSYNWTSDFSRATL